MAKSSKHNMKSGTNKSWKDTSKRRHQWHRMVSITIEPGYWFEYQSGVCIVPFDEVITVIG